jgi:hypothetical protein
MTGVPVLPFHLYKGLIILSLDIEFISHAAASDSSSFQIKEFEQAEW